MNFLIVTEPDDVHAIIVTLVLQSYDHQVVNLFSADFPTRQKNTICIDSQGYRCHTEDDFQMLNHVGYDVVWWRRPRQPKFAKNQVHPDDYKFHRRESLLFHENFTYQLAPGAWWVNRKEAAVRASYKLLQLKIANEVGMQVPATLCSNSDAEIVQFYLHHQRKGVVYKPLTYQVWQETEGFKVFYTSKIEQLETLQQASSQFYPGIYQECIPKQYELRVICFGDYIIAARINSQKYEEGHIDWRALDMHQLEIEPYVLPERLKQQIRFLMRELGIVFGCLDFIVTPDDQYIFLEVNEQGQFLFLEDCCEDLPMLDIFVYFLMQQSIDFYWIKRHNLHRVEDYRSAIDKIYQQNITNHLSIKGGQI